MVELEVEVELVCVFLFKTRRLNLLPLLLVPLRHVLWCRHLQQQQQQQQQQVCHIELRGFRWCLIILSTGGLEMQSATSSGSSNGSSLIDTMKLKLLSAAPLLLSGMGSFGAVSMGWMSQSQPQLQTHAHTSPQRQPADNHDDGIGTDQNPEELQLDELICLDGDGESSIGISLLGDGDCNGDDDGDDAVVGEW
jgi:hypothetical protein